MIELGAPGAVGAGIHTRLTCAPAAPAPLAPIAQAIAEAHGGAITARNVDGGHGAEFTVRIPASS